MVEPILDVRNLHKSYGERHAVQSLTFNIARGEIFGLLGPNGAGKTTTIGLLSGLIEPDAGHISLCGQPFSQSNAALKAAIGLVPQELALYPTLSARDNLTFFGRVYGLDERRLNERIAAVLELVGLADRAGDSVDSFSGGMKRRLNIAVGLLHEPQILFLDEPTVGVDPQSRNAIFEGIEALNRAGLTIVYTTHYMEEAQRLCQRVAIMDQGQLIAVDTPSSLIRSLGGGIIHMALGNGQTALLAERAAHLPTVKALAIRDGHVEIQAHQVQAAVGELIDLSVDLGARLSQLRILEPNLETVFLQLTGRALRD